MAGMKMYVHGGIGEDSECTLAMFSSRSVLTAVLWFASWQPTSAGATVGVCIGLFLLAILDRWIHALWRACSAGWNRGKIFSLPVASGPLPDSKTAAISSATAPATASKRKLEKSEKSSISEKVTERVAPESCQCGCGGECGSSSAAAAACCGDECVPSAPEYEAMDPLDDSYLPVAARGVDPRRPERWSRPFRWSVDVPRGLLYAFMNLIHFLLM